MQAMRSWICRADVCACVCFLVLKWFFCTSVSLDSYLRFSFQRIVLKIRNSFHEISSILSLLQMRSWIWHVFRVLLFLCGPFYRLCFADVRIAIPVWKFSNFDLEAHSPPCIWKTSWQEPQKRQIGKSDNPRLHPIFRVLFPCLRCCSADSAEGNHVHQSGFIESLCNVCVGSYLSRLPLLWTPCSAPVFLSSCNDKCYTAPSISLPCILCVCMSLSLWPFVNGSVQFLQWIRNPLMYPMWSMLILDVMWGFSGFFLWSQLDHRHIWCQSVWGLAWFEKEAMEMRKRDRLNNDGEQAGRTGIAHVRKEDRGRTVAIWMRGYGVTCKRSL